MPNIYAYRYKNSLLSMYNYKIIITKQNANSAEIIGFLISLSGVGWNRFSVFLFMKMGFHPHKLEH